MFISEVILMNMCHRRLPLLVINYRYIRIYVPNYGRHNIVLYPDKLNMYDFNVAQIYTASLQGCYGTHTALQLHKIHFCCTAINVPFLVEIPFLHRKSTNTGEFSLLIRQELLVKNGDYKEMCGVKAVQNICVVLLGCYNHSFGFKILLMSELQTHWAVIVLSVVTTMWRGATH